MTELDKAILTMRNELANLGWVIIQAPSSGQAIAKYQRLRDGKLEMAELFLENSVFSLKPMIPPKPPGKPPRTP
jgi:hypothetical protein